jgi:hypothetical protein
MNKKLKKRAEILGIWLILWISMKKREIKVKLLKLEKLPFKLKTEDSPYWMLQDIKIMSLT